MRSNFIQNTLNKIIRDKLPSINSAIEQAIQVKKLDPWKMVFNEKTKIDSQNLGIVELNIFASYNIIDMKGISLSKISSLVATSPEPDPTDTNKLSWNINAVLTGNLSAQIDGSLEAKPKIRPFSTDVNFSGTSTVTEFTANAKGSLTTNFKMGVLYIESIMIDSLSTDYNSVKIDLNNLKGFEIFRNELINHIQESFNGPIRSSISRHLISPIYTGLKTVIQEEE